jgi:hypothetical protein
LEAVATYRRTFADESRQFKVDAYAIGFGSGAVVLLRVDTKEELEVGLERLCREDKLWLSKNAAKIRNNGEKVRQFIKSNNW